MLKTRIITALIGIPILLGGLYLGGNYWRVLVVLLAGTALMEYMAMMRRASFKPIVLPAFMITLLLLFRVQIDQYLAGLFLASWLLMIMFVVLDYPRFNFSDLALSFFGAFYSGYLFSYALAVPELEGAFLFVLLSFILTWASDIGGYLFGMRWGKHKLSPQLSPGKTREGAVGAVVLTIIAAVSFKYIFSMEYLNLYYTILLGICADRKSVV